MKWLTRPITVNQFTFILAAYYVSVFNIPFFTIVREGLTKQADVNWLFVATIPLFLLTALNVVFSLFSVKYIAKPFFMLVTLISSFVFYAALKYHVVFDYGMIENTFQTNQAEAMTYVNLASIGNFLLTGILPALLIYKANIHYRPFTRELLKKLLFMAVNLVVIALIAVFFFQNYVAFGRNNDQMKRYIIPTYYIGSLAKYINVQYLQTPLKYKQLGLDAKLHTAKDAKPNLMVLVVGETARAKNYHYYGYHKDTNPFTQRLDMVAFNDVHSCGTATAVSLPCMFSRMNRSNYDARHAKAQDTLVDVLAHAGVAVNWLDNDSGCKGVCKRIKHITVPVDSDHKLCNGQFCYDQVLVDRLKQQLADIKDPRTSLVVLHIIGSHGPTYYLRYPDDKRLFTPDCRHSDIQNCSHEALVNAYDNTIAYTDFILSEVVGLLKQQADKFNTGLLYLSDHGESLGEKGMYLHGAPYAIAPSEQTHIPLLTWFSPGFVSANKLNMQCVRDEAKKGGYSQDNLFDSILGLMNVSTGLYRKQQDMFAPCRQ